jgi:lysine 2,3-aminomutase
MTNNYDLFGFTKNEQLEIDEKNDPPLPSSEKSLQFKNKYFPTITDDQWNGWHWQIKNSITNLDQLSNIFPDINIKNISGLPLRITPYYLSLIDNINSPIGRCVIPSENELVINENEEIDSLDEDKYRINNCIIHKYPDRVLFLTTDFCSTYCKYCTRSRIINKGDNIYVNKKSWDEGIKYIKEHTEVRDVLLSGGDIFTLSDENIEYLLSSIRAIKHVELLRLGTKVPVVLPHRITKNLINILKKYKVYVNIHFTHPDEITPEVDYVCNKMVDNGIVLGSQTVLLKNINDDIEIMKKLMHELIKIRVRPYYIYIADRVVGTSHFRTTLTKGIEIINGLRGHTSGLCVPTLILDTKYGKIDISNNILSVKDDVYELKTYNGQTFSYK